MELSYSLHLGSDKNKKGTARRTAKNNASGTTSRANNAIQNARGLSRVDHHNYRKYDNDTRLIEIIRGTSSIVDDVKNLYIKEFEKSKEEYNAKQTREDRKIQDYFSHISNSSKNDLACEIIIELGDKAFWDTKNMSYKKRMTSVYKQQVNDLETLVPNFKVCSAIIHYDETSPHMHIVGVPIKYKNKNGMSKQVGKSDVFTKESLTKLQDKMRLLCIESYNKEYDLNATLKKKQKGRNIDINVKDMDNYQQMKKELTKNQERLDNASQKSKTLDDNSKEIKKLVDNLKPTLTNKEKYVLKEEDKKKIEDYIESVNDTNKDYKKMKTLSITLDNVDYELKNSRKKIKTLTENNKALNLRVDTMSNTIYQKDREIKELEEENYTLKEKLNYWKNKFIDLINLIKHRIFHHKHRDNYYELSKDLYGNQIISKETFNDIKENYDYSKEHDYGKEKDDFDISL